MALGLKFSTPRDPSSKRSLPHKPCATAHYASNTSQVCHIFCGVIFLAKMRRTLFGGAIFASLITAAQAAGTCFYPDGITTAPNHTPCNSTVSESACCDPLDVCTTSGVCLGRTGFNYRGSCTDSTWQSGLCPSICHAGKLLVINLCLAKLMIPRDPSDNAPYSTYTALCPCDAPGAPSTNYCCDSPGRNCCTIATFKYGTTGEAFKGGMDLLLAQVANGSSSGQATDTANQGPFSDNGIQTPSVGPALGAGIGVPLGIFAVGFLAFLFWRETKRGEAAIRARMRVIEMDPGKPDPYNLRGPHGPAPPPKPTIITRLEPAALATSEGGTWSSQTSTIAHSRSPSSVQNTPVDTEQRVSIYELI